MNGAAINLADMPRCWECGAYARRQNPDSGALGCATCFPDWPLASPADGSAGGDER